MKYWYIFKKTFKSAASYRSAMWGNIAFTLLRFFMLVCLWSALIGSGVRRGVTVQDMIFYTVIGAFVQYTGSADAAGILEEQIADGSVVMHFLRPISFRGSLLATTLAEGIYWNLLSAVPSLLAALCFAGGLPLPATPLSGLCFLLSALLGMLISFEITYTAGLAAFWLQKTWYIGWFVSAGMTLFGGAMLPIWFFPDVLANITRYLPFRYVSFEAINMYLGHADIREMAVSLSVSVLWLLALRLLGELIWRRAQRKLTVNGG